MRTGRNENGSFRSKKKDDVLLKPESERTIKKKRIKAGEVKDDPGLSVTHFKNLLETKKGKAKKGKLMGRARCLLL